MADGERALARWRLVLGRFAEPELPPLAGEDARVDGVLDQLYGREYGRRSIRGTIGAGGRSLELTTVNGGISLKRGT